MATIETARYTRANLAVLDVFTRMMRDLLKTKVSSTEGLYHMTQQPSFQKCLTQQEKALCDTIRKSYGELDIGLVYKLIRFFKFIQAPSRGWGYLPQTNDLKIGDDVERVRISRNVLAHSPNPTLTEQEMESMFVDFKCISSRFDAHLSLDPSNGYAKAVCDYHLGTIDPETEGKYRQQINCLEEKHSIDQNHRRINIYFNRDVQYSLTNVVSREDSTKMKIYLHGVDDPQTVIKVLSAMVMEIMKMNYEIILDNVGPGSVILYITVTKKATIEERCFLSQLESFLLYIIDKGNIDFRFPENIAVVVVISDPLIDHYCHKLFDEFETIYDVDSAQAKGEEIESEEQLLVYRDMEKVTFQMAETRLCPEEVEKVLVEQATKENVQKIRNELRLIVIGKTGVGKSALGNFICGKDGFHSESGPGAVTQCCSHMKCFIHNRQVTVIDTPGIFDTEHEKDFVETQIRHCIGIGSPGPHAILFVMSLDERFKEEDNRAIREFLKFFGKTMLNYVLVVFTHADILERRNKSLEEYLKTSPAKLRDLLQCCGNRYLHLNTRSDGQERDQYLEVLFSEIDKIKLKNFEDENFRKTEELVVKREDEIAAEVERRLKKMDRELIERAEKLVESVITEKIFKMKKQAIQRLMDVRDEVRTEIDNNQSQFVLNGSKLSLHQSIMQKFPD